MSRFGMFFLFSGIFYLIYTLRLRGRKSYSFLFQFYAALLNGGLLIIAGFIEWWTDIAWIYLMAVPLTIHLINSIVKMMTFRKGYVDRPE